MKYAAMGDSLSGGCPGIDRPFPFGLADALGGAELVVLAEPGRTAEATLSDQLPRALELRPELVTVTCGVNDALTPHFDPVRTRATLRAIFDGLRAGLPDVVLGTMTYPLLPMLNDLPEPLRSQAFDAQRCVNQLLRDAAARVDAAVLDLEAATWTHDPSHFHTDHLHPSAESHERLAHGLLAILDLKEHAR